MRRSKEYLRTDGLKDDQVYVLITRLITILPSYSLGGATGIYAAHSFRVELYPAAGSQLETSKLLITGAVMGCLLAAYALQYRLFHLKFPELQRSKYHQLKARFAPSLVAALPAAAASTLVYAYLQQGRLTMVEAGNLVACAWPMASGVILSWQIAEVPEHSFLFGLAGAATAMPCLMMRFLCGRSTSPSDSRCTSASRSAPT